MSAFRCHKGRVVGTSDEPAQVVVRHQQRVSVFHGYGTVSITCECCRDELAVVLPEGNAPYLGTISPYSG
jgi:hypothetical protein